MAIYSFDGSQNQFSSMDSIPDMRSDVEQTQSPLSLFNNASADIAFAERQAAEIINISGAAITLYLKEPKRDAPEIEVWDEDADPLYRSGMSLKAFFKPEPTQQELTRWGFDQRIRITAVFSRATLLAQPGIGKRLVLPGDVIEAPYNLPSGQDYGPFRFRIINAKQSGFFKYRWLYVETACELLTGDEAVRVPFRGQPQ
jgi:hypothetical protein